MKNILFILLFFSFTAAAQNVSTVSRLGVQGVAPGASDSLKTAKDSLAAHNTRIETKDPSFLGDIYNLSGNGVASALYTSTAPNTTYTFVSNGVTSSGGTTTATNYIAFNAYTTNAFYYVRKIRFIPTSDGNGIGVGMHSANGEMVGKFIMTGASKGKVDIETYRLSTTTDRTPALSSALSYTNTTDTIELTLTRNFYNWRVTAQKVNSADNFVSVEWVDIITNGSVPANLRAASPAIYSYGGNQTIISDRYTVKETVGNDLLIYGNSIAAGINAQSGQFTAYALLKKALPGGVSIIAGGSNQTSDYLNLSTEIFKLKPKAVIYMDGVNDVINGVSLATTQANILTFVKDCFQRNVKPILCTVMPVGTSYPSAATINTNIVTINTWINTLGVNVIDLYTAVVSGGVLLAAYDAGDNIHPNALGNSKMYESIMATVLRQFTVNETIPAAYAQTTTSSTWTIAKDWNGNNGIYLSNPNTGTSATAGFRALSASSGGYFTSYPTNYAATAQYQGKTIFGNTGSGVIISALSASTGIEFHTNASTTPKWKIVSAGNITAGTDNTYDIGASGATRPRTGYFGTSVVAPTGTFATAITVPTITIDTKMNVTSGSNKSIGLSGAMTAGTITISTTAVTASSRIFLTPVGAGSGQISLGTVTAGTSFVINSSDGADTRTVQWFIIN